MFKVEKPRTIKDAIELLDWHKIGTGNAMSFDDLACSYKDSEYFEIKSWCEEYLDMNYITISDDGIYFYSEENLTLFKLKWIQ